MKAQLVAALLLFILLRMGVSLTADDDDGDDKLDDDFPRRLDKGRARANSNTCPKLRLRNGRVRIRGGGRVARFFCSPGFDMVGKRYATCVRGYWTNPPPVCVARGCDVLSPPKNGQVFESYKGAMVNFDCDPGYELVGSLSLHCDGYHWNSSIPRCQPALKFPPLECDFESEDLCGWRHDSTHDFDWRRHNFATPSGHVGTGPSHDHTLGEGREGHYMYIEASNPRKENDTARLLSPVYVPELSIDGCFTFWYHMYGATSGFLRVFVKPESLKVKDLPAIFVIAGDQGNTWFQGAVPLPLLQENFQIVVEGIRGTSYISDTAIDDVRLTNSSHCVMTHIPSSPGGTTRNISGSCAGRCNLQTPDAEQCQCMNSCLPMENCCPDYDQVCVSNGSTYVVLPQIPITTTSVVTETTSSVMSPIVVASKSVVSSVKLTSSISTPSRPSTDLSYSTLPIVSSPKASPSIQATGSAEVTQFLSSSPTRLASLSPSLKTISTPTITISSPSFTSSSVDLLSSLVESSVIPVMTPTSILRSSSIPAPTSAKRQSPIMTSIMSSKQPQATSSVGPIPTSVSSSLQEKSPVIPISSSDFTNSITVSSKPQLPITTSYVLPTSVVISSSVISPLMSSSCEPSDSCGIETSIAQLMTSLVPIVSASATLPPTSTVQTSDVINTAGSTSSETVSIQPTSVLVPTSLTLSTNTKEPGSKSLSPSTTSTSPPQSFSRAESSARTESAGFPAPVAIGIVVAVLLFGAVIGTAAYFGLKKHKLRREALAEDSDVRYLKDGEIQFGDGDKMYDDICL